MRVLGRDDDGHADAEVEHARHLVVGDVAEALDLSEDRRHLPGGAIDDGVVVVVTQRGRPVGQLSAQRVLEMLRPARR